MGGAYTGSCDSERKVGRLAIIDHFDDAQL
jgi:hypothetical protein